MSPIAAMPVPQVRQLNVSQTLAIEPSHVMTDEQVRRADAVAGAVGHLRMEGLFTNPLLDSLQASYIAGDLDIQGAIAAANRHYALG